MVSYKNGIDYNILCTWQMFDWNWGFCIKEDRFSPTNCFYLNNKRPTGEYKVSIYGEISKTDDFIVKLTGNEKSMEIEREAHE